MIGIDTLENGIETVVKTVDKVFSRMRRLSKDFMNYWAIRQAAKIHAENRRLDAIAKSIIQKISVRSYIITSMIDFNNKNKCSSMVMDSNGKFRRVR